MDVKNKSVNNDKLTLRLTCVSCASWNKCVLSEYIYCVITVMIICVHFMFQYKVTQSDSVNAYYSSVSSLEAGAGPSTTKSRRE